MSVRNELNHMSGDSCAWKADEPCRCDSAYPLPVAPLKRYDDRQHSSTSGPVTNLHFRAPFHKEPT